MRAVQLFAPADLRCVDIPKPRLEDNSDAIIKVKACGVCGSDLMRVMVKGAYRHPITIGHEFSGIVDEIASNDTGISSGDRVTVTPLIPCGRCDYCRIGQSTLCDDYDYYGSRTDGAMAEYVRVKIDNIIKLPLNVDFEAGAMTDPVAVALHAVRKCSIEPGQRVAVFGLGAIGLLAIQWLKHAGCLSVFAVDILDEKLQLAEKLGADFCINGKSSNTIEVINSITDNIGVDAVVELAGSKHTQVQAIEAVRKLGRVVYCGISYDDLLIPNSALSRILRGELAILGAWNSLVSPLPINEWKSSLDFVDRGKIKCHPIISHRFRLEDCAQAFDMMFNHREVFNKVLFKPEE
jgi:L-iditol 2-dehydrogenase